MTKLKTHPGVVAVVLAALVGLPTASAGTISGTVEVHPKPPRRSAQRYQNLSGGEIPPVAVLPTLVFVRGPVAGVPTGRPGATAIVQRGRQFDPDHLVVPVGTVVEFPNQDEEFHNVFSYSKARRFDLGRYPKGEAKTVTFETPGAVKVYCEIHPWMRAAVLVVENPFYAVVDDDGRFAIDGVPPGRYTLVAWDMDVGDTETTVTVPEAGGAEVELKLAADRRGSVTEEVVSVGRIGGGDGSLGCHAGVEP